jgi:transposase
LTRHLLAEGVPVVEVDRPNRRLRRQRGKSDPIDAEAAARAVLAGTATVPPKDRRGIVESIRALRAARSGAVKARGAALNGLKAMIVSAPVELRAALDHLHTVPLVNTCAALRPDRQRLGDALQGTKAALRSLARRIVVLEGEISELDV